jgi:methionine synthase I (cobalamin-dependent)
MQKSSKNIGEANQTSVLKAQEFAQQMVECYRAGARLLGGCCGTDPSHIKALIETIGKEV